MVFKKNVCNIFMLGLSWDKEYQFIERLMTYSLIYGAMYAMCYIIL